MKKGFVIAAVVLIAVGIVLFSVAFISSGFDFSKLSTAKVETNSYTVSGEFEKIDIRADEADITFKQAEDHKLRVECVEWEKVKRTVAVEDGTLKITVDDEREWYERLMLFSFKPQSITVYLPNDYYKALSVSAYTGDVSVPKEISFAEAEITISTGSVDLGASVDGRLTIETSTGDVRLDHCDAGQITVKTTTGDVTGSLRTEKEFIAKTSTGDIDVPDTTSGGKCEITTSTGDIRITVDEK